jgi:hypothetical protein
MTDQRHPKTRQNTVKIAALATFWLWQTGQAGSLRIV